MIISGVISDSYGLLDGVNIVLMRNGNTTSLGTSSNDEGKFELDNKNIKDDDTFRFSFVGLKTKTFKAKDLKNKQIFLEEDIDVLDEVVLTNKKEEEEEEEIGVLPIDINKRKNTNGEWYTSPVFLLSGLGLITLVTIVFIIKKTK